jgi:Ring finger domain
MIRWFLLRTTTRHNSLLEKHNTGGLDSAAIAALPTFPYKDNNVDEVNNGSSMECSICLSTVEEGEMVKLLPVCMHSFHGDCVGLWLSGHTTCPVCRIEVLGSMSAAQYQPNQVELVVVPVLDIERRP